MSEKRLWPNAYRERLCNFYIPRRFQKGESIDARAFVDYLNDFILNRGLVMYDGLIVTKPFSLAIDKEPYVPAYREFECINGILRLPISLNDNFSIQVEIEDKNGYPFPDVDEWKKDFRCPERQEWSETQQKILWNRRSLPDVRGS